MRRLGLKLDKALTTMTVLCVVGACVWFVPTGFLRLYERLAYARQPRVCISEPRHDWGSAIEGQRVRHAFRIENRGGQPLSFPREPLA